MNTRALLLAITLGTACAPAPDAAPPDQIEKISSALVSPGTPLNDPWGSSVPVTVRVGYYAPTNSTYVFWQRKSDGTCLVHQIGNPIVPTGSSLAPAFIITGSTGHDDMGILAWTDTFTCTGSGSYTLTPPVLAARSRPLLVLNGGNGDDAINCASGRDDNTFNACNGEGGNDLLFNYGHLGAMSGGDGDDILWTNKAGVYMQGDDGVDCLDASASTEGLIESRMDCGPGAYCAGCTGADSVAPDSHRVPLGVNCEISVDHCF